MNAKFYDHEHDFEVEDVDNGRSRREPVRARKPDANRRQAPKGRKSQAHGGLHQRRNKHWSW